MKTKTNVKRVALKIRPLSNIPEYKCPYCGFSWSPRVSRPKVCPNPECHKKLPWVNLGRPKKIKKGKSRK
jgi:rubrerythrin